MPETPLTILIPTRNRCETLRTTLQTCTDQNYDRLQIIVSDNVSEDETRAVVESVRDPRVRYIRPDRRLSMSGNFEFTLQHAPAGYLMHLGDDDAVIADGLAYVNEVIAETGAAAVTSSHALYHWPSSLFLDRRNRLVISRRRGFEMRSSIEAARAVIDFKRGYSILPSTYSAFVNKSVIEQVKAGGRYYHSITPDSYSGFANAGVLDRYAYSFRPFAIAGISGRSNGASNFTREDNREASNYLRENDLPLHPDIVYSQRSVELIVAEAFLQARDHVAGLADVKIDYERLCRIALRDATGDWYPEVREAVLALKMAKGLGVATPPKKSLSLKIEGALARAQSIAWRLSQGYRRVDLFPLGITDIGQVSRWAAKMFE